MSVGKFESVLAAMQIDEAVAAQIVEGFETTTDTIEKRKTWIK